MEAFALVYSIALIVAIVAAGAFAIGCVVMLFIAHRRGRLRHAVAGAFAGFNRSRSVREPATHAPRHAGIALAPVSAIGEVGDTNPATGLPMIGADIDLDGNLYGSASSPD